MRRVLFPILLSLLLAAPVAAAAIVIIDHETGDLSQYDDTNDAAYLAVTNQAALVGTYGLSCTVESMSEPYGQKDFVVTTNALTTSFHVDINSITTNENLGFEVLRIYNYPDILTSRFGIRVRITYEDSSYQLTVIYYDDDYININSDFFTISDEPHHVVLNWYRAQNESSEDGQLNIYIDDVLQQSITNIDNYDMFVTMNQVRFGVQNPSGPTLGTLYLDDLSIDDGQPEVPIPYPFRWYFPILFRRATCL